MKNSILVLCASSVIISCQSGPVSRDARLGLKYEVEVETVEQQALHAVRETPTEFFVPLADDPEAWDRAKLFFIKYLEIETVREIEKLRTRKFATLSSTHRSDHNYHYEVKKELFGHGYNYSVKCKPHNSPANVDGALLNAQNLSRFISQGTLETSLLK
mgnify:CR=1 FL=1